MVRNCTEATLNVSPNVVVDPNDETNFPHKLLLIDTSFEAS